MGSRRCTRDGPRPALTPCAAGRDPRRRCQPVDTAPDLIARHLRDAPADRPWTPMWPNLLGPRSTGLSVAKQTSRSTASDRTVTARDTEGAEHDECWALLRGTYSSPTSSRRSASCLSWLSGGRLRELDGRKGRRGGQGSACRAVACLRWDDVELRPRGGRHAAYGRDDLVAELVAQVPDRDLDDVGSGREGVAPQVAENLLAREHLVGWRRKTSSRPYSRAVSSTARSPMEARRMRRSSTRSPDRSSASPSLPVSRRRTRIRARSSSKLNGLVT